MGWNLDRDGTQAGVGFRVGQDLGRLGVTFEHGAGPLLRTCLRKGRGSTSKGGPLECGVLECGVPESGGRALSEGVWVGFRSSALAGVSEGVSECRGGALGGGVGAGLGLCGARGKLRGQRIRPGSPTGFPVPKWTGKALAPFLRAPPPPSPAGSPHRHWTPNRGGSRWV